MPDAAHVLRHHGGVCRGVLLQQYGLTRRAIASEVRAGAIMRIRPGVFALPSAAADAVTAAEHGGAVTCLRALRLHGVWALGDDDVLHVWVGGKGRRHHGRCVCIDHHFAGRTALGLTPLEDVLVHTWQCAGDEAFFAALESALSLRKISRSARDRIRARLPERARWLVELARADAGSGLESLLRLRLHLLGIRLDCQVEIPTVGRVDFVIAGRLILEADGTENHDDATHRHADRVRDAAASVLGYETLRFDYAQIVHDWPAVEAAVLAAIERLRVRS